MWELVQKHSIQIKHTLETVIPAGNKSPRSTPPSHDQNDLHKIPISTSWKKAQIVSQIKTKDGQFLIFDLIYFAKS